MCMHDNIVIVVDDYNSGAQRQAEPARPRCTSHLCCMCVLFPFPRVSSYPLLFCSFCYVRCCQAGLCCMTIRLYILGSSCPVVLLLDALLLFTWYNLGL